MKKIFLAFLLISLMSFTRTAKAQRLLTLEQSVEEALKQSPDIVSARLELERNRELLNAEKASLKSNFSLDLTPLHYTKSSEYDDYNQNWFTRESLESLGTFNVSQPILATDGVISLYDEFGWGDNSSTSSTNVFRGFSNTLNLRLVQPLFTYNKTKMEYKVIEFNYENAKLNFALQALNVEKQVTQYFYQIYQKQMELITSREELQNRTQSFEIIKNKVEAGLTAKEEMLQAELDMMSSKSTVQNNEVEFENIKDNFKLMLGLSFNEEIMVIAEVSVLPVDVNLDEAVEYALENRMEIRQRQIDIETGQFDIITANATNEFKGDLTVDIGLMGNAEKVGNIYDKENRSDNQDVSFGLTIPLWDWGEKKSNVEAAQIALKSREYDLENEKKDIVLTVRQIERNLRNYLMQIDIAKKNEENAQLTYEINLEKYRNGDLTSMDLNLVQNQLTQNKNSKTDALINYKLELLNMKLQTLYDFENERSIMPDVIKYETIQQDN